MLEHAIDIFHAGGWVMYPLLAMSILSMTLILERAYFWMLGDGRSGAVRLKNCLNALQSQSATQIASDANKSKSLEGQFLTRAMSSNDRSEPMLIGYIETLRPSIERFAPTLGAIIAAAPLLGILGTVTGIIQSFDLLGEAASVSDPTIVAGGIAEALYTTAFGLCIALFTLFPHVYFKSSADKALGRLEILAGAVLNHDE